MAEFIQKTDTLNQGREKLNEAIKDANKAKVDAGAAVSTSNTAKQIAQTAEHKADSVQAQFDQVIIEGDSSVEAAAARVDTENISHPTLKARLDAEHSSVTSQLADIAINVKSFGAKGDGFVDDTSSIQNTIDFVVSLGGGTVFIPSGRYYITSPLMVTSSDINIKGVSGSTFLDCKDSHTLESIILVKGKILSETEVTTDLLKESTTLPITVTSPSVIIQTNELYNSERSYYKKGEFLAVDEDGMLVDSLSDDYRHLNNDLKILEIDPVENVVIEDINFIKNFNTNASNTSGGVKFHLTTNCSAKNLQFENFDYFGLGFDRVYKCSADNIQAKNGNKETGLAYGVVVSNSCRKVRISNCKGKKLRHLIAFGSSGLGMPRYATVSDCFDEHSYISSYDIHAIAEYIHYINCVGEDYSFGGKYNTFESCIFLPATHSSNYANGNKLSIGTMPDYSRFINCDFRKIVGWKNETPFSTDVIGIEFINCKIEVFDNKDVIGDFNKVSYFYNLKNTSFINNRVYSNVTPATDANNLEIKKASIEMTLGSGSNISGNIFENIKFPIRVLSSLVNIKNNVFKDCFDYNIGVYTSTLQNHISNITISGNEFIADNINFNSGSGRYVIFVSSNIQGKTINSFHINNNTIQTNQLNCGGIHLKGDFRVTSRNRDFSVSGNIIKNVKTYGIFVGHDYQNVLLTGNFVFGGTGSIIVNQDGKVLRVNNITEDIV